VDIYFCIFFFISSVNTELIFSLSNQRGHPFFIPKWPMYNTGT